jgi:hypothetical protein
MAGLPLLATSLDSKLSDTPSNQGFRRAVINKMWTKTFGQNEFSKKSAAYNAYFVHIYEPLCHAGSSGDFEEQIRAVTHAELLDITIRLQTGLETGSQMMQTERTVKLAAGIFLPLNFGSIRGAHRPGRVVNWGLDQSLTQLVESTFLALCTPQQQPQIWQTVTSCSLHPTCSSCASTVPSTAQVPVLTMDRPINARTSYFPRSFSAYKLNYIAGFQVIWTSNLLDHLRLVDEDDTGIKVFIFHHTILLDLHLSLLR